MNCTIRLVHLCYCTLFLSVVTDLPHGVIVLKFGVWMFEHFVSWFCVFLIGLSIVSVLVAYKTVQRKDKIQEKYNQLVLVEKQHLQDANYWMHRATTEYIRRNYLQACVKMVRDRPGSHSFSDAFIEAYIEVYGDDEPDYTYLYSRGPESLNTVIQAYRFLRG